MDNDAITEVYRSKDAKQAMAHLAEELAEATTAAAKCLRFGPYSVNPELPDAEQETNIVWLKREMRDAIIAYLAMAELLVDRDYMNELADDILRVCGHDE